MSLNMTQFALTQIAGEPMNIDPMKISARVVSTSNPTSGYLQGGDFVTFHPTEVGNLPVVQQAVSGVTKADGMVVFNAKKNQYSALDIMEIAMAGSIMTAIAGGSFNRGAILNYVPGTVANTPGYVFSTSAGVGVATSLDISSALGNIVKVRIL